MLSLMCAKYAKNLSVKSKNTYFTYTESLNESGYYRILILKYEESFYIKTYSFD